MARDAHGVWHVVECKGTQSGLEYSNHQMIGGKVQKRAIVFPRSHTGQRLVCGLSIGVENGAVSHLTIADPEPEDPFEIGRDQMELADDAVTRGVMSKVLRLAGFETVAEATASPLGRSPAATRFPAGKREDARRRTVDERNNRAREELEQIDIRASLFDRRYRGRELNIVLPRPVYLDDRPMMRVIVRQGLNEDILAQLRENPMIEDPITDGDVPWARSIGRNTIKGDERSATMEIGKLFRSEIILE